MNIAVILSAGSGSRFNSSSPKQFLTLNQSPVLCHSVSNFEDCNFINYILIVSHPEYIEKTKRITSSFKKVSDVIHGGERRQDSVWNALCWIKENQIHCSTVFIHDSARPLFSKDLIKNLYEASKSNKAVIPVIPVDDTIKSLEQNLVKETLDRSKLVRVQTPQVFDFSTIYKTYSEYPKEKIATDDAFIAEYFGINVFTIPGEKNNIKITHSVDLKVIEVLMNEVG